jgi:hypothetical protein
MSKIQIRVTTEGKEAKRELLCDGVKVCDVSFIELVEFIMQASSSLRWR